MHSDSSERARSPISLLIAAPALVAFALWAAPALAEAPLTCSERSGPWSSPRTWESGKVPASGARVLIRPGDTVTYDVSSSEVIRFE